MQLDIDRLHRNLEALQKSEHLPRMAGKTTAILSLLAGELQLGDPNTYHLVCTVNASIANRIRYQFCEMLDELDVKYRSSPTIVQTHHNQIVLFLPYTEFDQRAKGMKFRTVSFDIPTEFIGLPPFTRDYICSYLEETTYATD